ncbi:MAG: methyltransferase domain-containing protein [Endomicrobium sp.]|nr:methyltransferase domain-containing protein [Endomicrobium sp.]
MSKASVDEIRARFDNDIERFSNLDRGQSSFVDSKLSLEIATESAKRLVPHALNLLDVGSGAGNYTLKMLSKSPNLNCTLIDLSKPMLDKALDRISKQTIKGKIQLIQSDIRNVELENNSFDIILSGAALHHLRNDGDWENIFAKFYKALKQKGCLIISDLIFQNNNLLTDYMLELYSNYLNSLGGEDFCQGILNKIEKEDTPRPLDYQLDLMKKVGFKAVEVLHKNMCFAVFGAIK